MERKIYSSKNIDQSTEEGKLLYAALQLLTVYQTEKPEHKLIDKLHWVSECSIPQYYYLQVGYSKDNVLWYTGGDSGSANLTDSPALTEEEAIEISTSYNTLWPCEYIHSLMAIVVDHRPMDLSKRKL